MSLFTSSEKVIRELIKAGADVNERNEWGCTPLHYQRNIGSLKVLIEAGADVNARNDWGFTPLYFEKDNGYIKLLIDAGANVNARNEDGDTPLHLCRDEYYVIELIEAGADMKIKNNYGSTSLQWNPIVKYVVEDMSSEKITRFIRNCKWLRLYKLTRTFAFNKWYCGEDDGNGGGTGRKVDHKRIMDTFVA